MELEPKDYDHTPVNSNLSFLPDPSLPTLENDSIYHLQHYSWKTIPS